MLFSDPYLIMELISKGLKEEKLCVGYVQVLFDCGNCLISGRCHKDKGFCKVKEANKKRERGK